MFEDFIKISRHSPTQIQFQYSQASTWHIGYIHNIAARCCDDGNMNER